MNMRKEISVKHSSNKLRDGGGGNKEQDCMVASENLVVIFLPFLKYLGFLRKFVFVCFFVFIYQWIVHPKKKLVLQENKRGKRIKRKGNAAIKARNNKKAHQIHNFSFVRC